MDTSAWLKNAVKLALCLFAVPLLGWLTGMYLENSYEGQFQQMLAEQKLTSTMTYSQFCAKLEDDGTLNKEPEALKLCSPAADVRNVFRARSVSMTLRHQDAFIGSSGSRVGRLRG